MASKPRHRYSVGDVVVWTDYTNGTEHRCEIRGHVELTDEDVDYDLAANGPLYDVRLKPGQRGQMQVAEVDLSPLPPPVLEAVGADLPEVAEPEPEAGSDAAVIPIRRGESDT